MGNFSRKVCLLFVLSWTTWSVQGAELLKVGIYESDPVAYRTGDGTYHGLAISVLEEVAKKNDWSLDYVVAPLPELLTRLEHGQIDIVVGVANVAERSQHYELSRETLISNWGVVYRAPGTAIETYLDLAGKRIAMMEGSNQSLVLQKLLRQFNVEFSKINAVDYAEVLRLITEGKAEAGVVDRFSTITNGEISFVEPTPIVFNPIDLRYAARHGLEQLLVKIDNEVRSEKRDPNSLFNNFLEHGLGSSHELANHQWFKWLIIGIVAALILLLLVSLLLRREVKRRVDELRHKSNELRKTRNELERDKEFLTALLNNMQDGVMACDADGTLTVFNRAARAMLGYTDSELPAERWTDIYNLYDHNDQRRLGIKNNPLYLAWRGATVHDLPVTVIPPGGDVRTALVNGQAFYGADSKKLGAVVSYHDVTEYKRAESSLLRLNAEFKAIFNSIDDVVIYSGTSNRIMMANPASRELFGYTPNELIGSDFEMLVADSERDTGLSPGAAARLRAVAQAKSHVIYSRKDGSLFIGDTTSAPVVDETGTKIGAITVIRDVTARLAAEADARRANRALRAIKAANEAISRAKDETQLFNDICRMCVDIAEYRMAWIGVAQQDASKRVLPVAEAGFGDDYLKTARIAWDESESGSGPTGRAIRIGKPVVARFIMTDPMFEPWRAAAEKRGYRSSAALPLMLDGRPYGALNIYSAASDAFDEEEVRLLGELAADVMYGVASLRAQSDREQLQRQLRQAQKMEAVGQLTGGIAHDFNNILASVLGYADLALYEKAVQQDATLRMYVEEILKSGKRARDLVAKLLAFSRGGNEPVRPTTVAPLLKEMLQMLRATLPVTIKTDLLIDPELPAVMTDSVQFQQVFLNLCINARDAMPEGGVIAVTAKLTSATAVCTSCNVPFHGDFVEISVRDTGAGIDADLLHRIFDPFFTTKEVGKGSGMGLSVVHGIVHSMGGHLLVESTPDVGTTFKIYLLSAEARASESASEPKNPELAQLRGRVLVVDDDISVARMMERTLEQRGLEVEVVTESKHAVDLFDLKADGFDLVVTDHQMPGMSGIDMAKQLIKMRPSLPVVLYTAYSDVTIGNRAREAGVVKVLHKPVDVHELLRTLDELLRSKEKVVYLNNPRPRQ